MTRGAENGVVIIWLRIKAQPEFFDEIRDAARAIVDSDFAPYARIECVDPDIGHWSDCEDDVLDEVERIRQDIADTERDRAALRAQTKV